MSRLPTFALGICLLVLSLLAAGPAGAAPVGFSWVELPGSDDSLEQVRRLPESRWQTLDAGDVFNRGFSDGTFWLRVPVSPEPVNRVLEIGYPLLDDVSVFWVRNGQMIESHRTGDRRPFSSRPIYHRDFVFLVPSKTEPVTAYIRVRTQGSVQIPVAITPSAQFLAHEQLSYGWQMTFLGILVAMVMYNLFLFAIVRDSTYLWYVLAVIASGLVQLNFHGLVFQWLWPDTPILNRYFTVPAVGLALLFATVFTLKFLSVARYSKPSYRFMQAVVIGSGLSVVYGLFGPYQSGIELVSVLAAITTPAAWLIGLLVWRRGQVLGGFYVLAWTPLLAGHLILAISKLGIMPRSALTELAPQAGVALEVILLSFALAYRINLERRRRQEAQDRALEVQRQANLTLESRVRERTEELEQAYEQIKSVSLTDGLTQVANRRRFEEKLHAEWKRAHRQKEALSLLLLDIDYFKRVNDELGHLVGDDCLVTVAEVLSGVVQRSGDLVARYGGEEFVVLLPATQEDGAVQVAERLRQAVARTAVHTREGVPPVHLTTSVGVATLSPRRDLEPHDLVRHADEALYAAKASGRNRVMVYRDSAAAPAPGL
ncbi:diguanylate cyclase [Marinobacter koreensis]|uniref:diguanylate cyclase n=2 Tax=Bacteria TaxID=2 RepID=A0ABW0RSD5_9GAMM|nr:diguanylate cyclase [Marinobacter koreensis]MCK7548021.1 diguanylate cyclase [Marinobacter koreensis]